jgi:hypothetical protein
LAKNVIILLTLATESIHFKVPVTACLSIFFTTITPIEGAALIANIKVVLGANLGPEAGKVA